MKLVSYRENIEGEIRVGILRGDYIVDVEALGEELEMYLPSTMLELIDMGQWTLDAIAVELKDFEDHELAAFSVPYSNAVITAPIPRPRKNIFGIGLNYTEHVAESARALDTSNELPQKCVIFSKPTSAVVGPGDAIKHFGNITQQMDWEGELAVVIGKRAQQVKKEDALNYVFGYTIINDVSARDCRRSGQWIVSKGQDTYAPMGPCIVTPDEIGNPHDLQIRTHVNGVEKQNGNTKYMLFDVAAIIEDISEGMTLEPGDIIATGTPAGVGAGRDPQEWMWPGDVVEISIEKIGTLRNYVVKG